MSGQHVTYLNWFSPQSLRIILLGHTKFLWGCFLEYKGVPPGTPPQLALCEIGKFKSPENFCAPSFGSCLVYNLPLYPPLMDPVLHKDFNYSTKIHLNYTFLDL